jgi:predicted MPP superfamily phosphohydrolase
MLMKKLSIQILSDIHLEFSHTFPKIKPHAKYLCLSGDIGTISNKHDVKVKNFLSYCSSNWEKTFYVLGNHEFYQVDDNKICLEDLETTYQEICQSFPNVYLLNNNYQEIVPGLNIYGTTLWTNNYGFPKTTPACNMLNDYNMITTKSKKNYNIPLTEKYINDLSVSQLNSLATFLQNTDTNRDTNTNTNNNNKSIIMTHFPPIRQNTSNPKYSSQPEYATNYFSWNNIYSYLNCNNIIGWISGHTHWSHDFMKDNIRFVSNQTGYSKEHKNGVSKFEPDKVFEIEY